LEKKQWKLNAVYVFVQIVGNRMNAKSVTSVISALENTVKASVRMADSSQIIKIGGNYE